MMAAEAGYAELVELMTELVGPELLLETCEQGSCVHAAITGRKPVEMLECIFGIC